MAMDHGGIHEGHVHVGRGHRLGAHHHAGLMVWTDSDIAPLVALAVMAVVFIAIGARARRSRHH